MPCSCTPTADPSADAGGWSGVGGEIGSAGTPVVVVVVLAGRRHRAACPTADVPLVAPVGWAAAERPSPRLDPDLPIEFGATRSAEAATRARAITTTTRALAGRRWR